jgi:hypothetical protein
MDADMRGGSGVAKHFAAFAIRTISKMHRLQLKALHWTIPLSFQRGINQLQPSHLRLLSG